MMYVMKVEHYEEWSEKVKPTFMFVCADTTVEAVQYVSDYSFLVLSNITLKKI